MAAVLIAFCGVAFLDLPAQAQSREAYRVGMKIARERGYPNPQCYARVFAQHAQRANHPQKANYWSAPARPAFTGELWSQCRISR